jgi:hypothetical protein
MKSKNTLSRLRKHFPDLKQVVDAKESITINVIARDSKMGNKKDPYSCALVQACKRTHIADGALIGIGYSYLVKDQVATRYKTSAAVGREITTFDRFKKFAPGINYRLSKIAPTNRLEAAAAARNAKRRERKKGYHLAAPPKKVHRTAFIRKVTA